MMIRVASVIGVLFQRDDLDRGASGTYARRMGLELGENSMDCSAQMHGSTLLTSVVDPV